MTEQLKAPREARALAQWAYALFEEFRAAYAGEWNRLEKAVRMYRGDHWWDVPVRDPNEPRPLLSTRYVPTYVDFAFQFSVVDGQGVVSLGAPAPGSVSTSPK